MTGGGTHMPVQGRSRGFVSNRSRLLIGRELAQLPLAWNYCHCFSSRLDNHTIISNVSQRTGTSGRPAIFANHSKYEVQNVTNTLVQIPWGVEAVWCVWCVLTPKNISNDSQIQKIACCAVYCKPNSKKKTLLLDHISDAYNVLKTKFGRGLHFVITGDTNDWKLDSILSLDPNFSQIVKHWTRMNPPAILDPIIMTLSRYYQEPLCLDPLDSDPDKNGVP